ncbi:MAG: tetratricopeptide repeat protein [Crocinitomicaceae bacterium]|nr:tetratricopeptide repeat protein [Crocinitomicaceae bacterium]
MNRILLILMTLCTTGALAQTSDKYNSEYADFYRAEDLYVKEQYSAARREFREFINGFDQPSDPMYVKARYYEAVSALELYNNDAIPLLNEFNRNYPESIYKKDIYYRMGKFYYQKKKFDDALSWFNKLSIQDIEEEDRDEFYFKMGYANFQEKNFEEARSAFHEVKDGESQYAKPSLYYYSHIEYQNKKYQAALNGFLKLEDDEKFGKVVPYYIAQIYYLQGRYDEVTKYATKMNSQGTLVNEKNMNHLIGDAFYRTGRYDEAVPFLEEYNRQTQTTRSDDYRLGFAYYKSGACTKAIRMFDKVKTVKDSLGQVSYYHIAECLLKQGNKVSARSAFEGAAFMDMDPVVQEDALFNYAILSYELDINPYDEAVEAFEMYLKKFPNSDREEDVYQYLVNVYMSTNNYAKALASLDKIVNKDVALKTAYQLIAFNQGVKRFQVADFPGAIQSFRLVDRYPIDPTISGKAVFWEADANYRLNRLNEAIAGYKMFAVLPATLAPTLQKEAKYNIGYAYLRKHDTLRAIESFGLYLQTNPQNRRKKADAFMRIADGHYVLKHNELAVKNYQEVVALKAGYEDQALFYMAKTYGLMGKPQNKISRLLEIVNNHKGSKYLQTSIFEVAKSYNMQGNLTQALKYFRKIVFDYPSSILVVDSRLNIASIYFKQGDHVKAETEYKAILAEHGENQDVCEAATRGLIGVYTSLNQQEKVEALVEQYACANFTVDEKEDMYYLPAMKKYQDSAYADAVPLFEKYLSKFSNGRYTNDVKNYLANSYFVLGNIDQAVELYKETLEGPNTGFTELAASRVAHHLYTEKKYDEVIYYYQKLERISSDPETIFASQLGLMRCHFLIENWTNAVVYADKVLSNSQINNTLKLEGNYAKGMGNYYLGNYDSAKTSLVWVFKNTTTVKAAEARYTLAELFYKQNFLAEADEEVAALLKQKPTYNFWIAKGLILRTRILIMLDDLFQAEQTLKSVIDHYQESDDGILDEANELWNELMQMKDDNKSLTPDVDPIIEINEEEGGN